MVKPKESSSEWEMYITDFPPHMDSQDLRKICAEFGTVADVYFPRILSKSGKRFALVKFLLRVQDDASELAKKLSVISIGYYHLFANLTRQEKKPFYQSQTRQISGDLNIDRPTTYASIVVTGIRNGVTKVEEEKEIPLDRPEFQDMVEEDRISVLPDCLLVEILSRLPSTKEAIGTGILSKRWKQLWTWLPTLIFDEDQITFPLSDYFSTMDKILSQCRQLKLKKFQVYIYYDTEFVSQFKNWLCYAVSCNVEELNISCEPANSDFVLDQFFFTRPCFTDLRVAGFTMNPTGAISWNKLRSLSISEGNLDEDIIENILSGSPVLETLELDDCYGYRRLNITSKSVKNLVISTYWPISEPSLTHIIAPNILSLTIQHFLKLWKPFLLNVPSLVVANLDYRWGGGTSLISEEEALEGFILNLSHIKELIIGVSCSQVLSRLETKGFVFPSNMRIREGFERVEYVDSITV